ncbi:hypothetical protein AVEN_270757-1 [Araneus ventricosus]|uniref:Uncharacterized protein n=1 Tax=Araneus ventricosus TaxID=182803 RepID=A0A4Y2DSB8_ARAVE|nr:hypothetical protein AVEN_270757-1 [Araneus ventricosus]
MRKPVTHDRFTTCKWLGGIQRHSIVFPVYLGRSFTTRKCIITSHSDFLGEPPTPATFIGWQSKWSDGYWGVLDIYNMTFTITPLNAIPFSAHPFTEIVTVRSVQTSHLRELFPLPSKREPPSAPISSNAKESHPICMHRSHFSIYAPSAQMDFK